MVSRGGRQGVFVQLTDDVGRIEFLCARKRLCGAINDKKERAVRVGADLTPLALTVTYTCGS